MSLCDKRHTGVNTGSSRRYAFSKTRVRDISSRCPQVNTGGTRPGQITSFVSRQILSTCGLIDYRKHAPLLQCLTAVYRRLILIAVSEPLSTPPLVSLLTVKSRVVADACTVALLPDVTTVRHSDPTLCVGSQPCSRYCIQRVQ